MPSTSNTDSNPVDQQPAEEASATHEHTPEYFRREALKTIEELRVPKNTLAELQSSLALIMKKHDFDTSYIDQMAEWFKKEAWWFEARSAAVLTAGAIALTFAPVALVMASIIASISISLYYLAKFFLVDHYDRTSRREQRISDHITQMEANVLDSVILLNEAEKQLKLMLIALCEINASSAEKLQTFEDQTLVLNTEMTRFLESIDQLEDLKNSLVRDNEILSSRLNDAVNTIEQSKIEIEQGALMFDSVTNDLAETNKMLLKRNDGLIDLHNQFQSKLASLAQFEESFQEQLSILQHRVAMDDERRSRLYSSDMTLNHQLSLDEILENTVDDDALILAELAMREFDTHMEEIARYRQNPAHSSASMRFFTSTSPSTINASQQPSLGGV